MNKVLLLLLLIIQLFSNVTINSQNVVLEDFEFEYFIDKTNAIDFHEALKSNYENISHSHTTLGFLNNQTVWIKIDINSTLTNPQTLYFSHKTSFNMTKFNWYVVQNNTLINSSRAGYLDLTSNSTISDINGNIPLKITNQSTTTLYLQLQSNRSMILNFGLYDIDHLQHSEKSHTLFYALLIGIMFALIIYNTSLYIFTHDKAYLFYVGYVTPITIMFSNFTAGFNIEYFHIFGEINSLNIYLLPIHIILLSLFIKEVLQTKKRLPYANIFLNSLIGAVILWVVFTFFINMSSIRSLLSIISLIGAIGIITIAIIATLKKFELALFVVIATGLYLSGAIYTLLFYLKVIDYDFVALNSQFIGLVLEGILFSIMLSFRINMLEKIKEEQKQELIQQSRQAQMGELLSVIAHQLKQPLATMSATLTLNQVKLLKNDEYTKESIEKLFTLFANNIQHLSITIDEFRNFFNPHKHKELIVVNEVVDTALFVISMMFSKSNITIEKEYESNREIMVLKNELMQVILNILNNSIDSLNKVTTTQRVIKIKTYDTDLGTHVEISDNGGGINPKIIDKIFDKYFTTKPENKGTGLGLYLCKTIVEQNCKGAIIASNIENGAQFKLFIPKSEMK